MAHHTLIVYATIDGHTRKICQRIREILETQNQRVTLRTADELHENLSDYDAIIIASSIRYGKHNPKIIELIEQNTEVLSRKKAAFVSVNLVARKAEKNQPDTNPYVIKFLSQIRWKPTKVAVFAGKLNYKIYSFWDKIMIKLIMVITKGPTRSDTEIDYTDWDKVTEFATEFAAE
ncbi:MAG: menaquinone-dependent protoporphyrinogen IX dehydrogenase [Capnocytophaga sp.]|nr:menaquinone-dependent protoporphyrinogen IX dehydrogenase [Capnocytophaga sp.]